MRLRVLKLLFDFIVTGSVPKQNIRFLFCSKNGERGTTERFDDKFESCWSNHNSYHSSSSWWYELQSTVTSFFVYSALSIYICIGTSGQNQPGLEQTTASSQLPYPTQFQGGMPIPYGAGPAAPYPSYIPPPMPTAYNPYATMPYPAQGNSQMLF